MLQQKMRQRAQQGYRLQEACSELIFWGDGGALADVSHTEHAAAENEAAGTAGLQVT
jgi:hypothetical protein